MSFPRVIGKGLTPYKSRRYNHETVKSKEMAISVRDITGDVEEVAPKRNINWNRVGNTMVGVALISFVLALVYKNFIYKTHDVIEEVPLPQVVSVETPVVELIEEMTPEQEFINKNNARLLEQVAHIDDQIIGKRLSQEFCSKEYACNLAVTELIEQRDYLMSRIK